MADPFSGSQNSRAGNALQKRQEALKRWKGSETDREPPDRSRKKTKIKFSSGTVFLSAISSGDVDEVKKLLAKDADINFQNVDGLTALHQACIDENYDLVKLLVDKGARLDLRDNEGWTPLHAAASCGSVEIAQYLIDSGADIASVNNEGELPLDLAEEEEMEDLLTEEIENQGIDVVEARGEEERIMTEHAQSWLNKRKVDEILDRSGATALHVACSKGYIKVINLLLQVGVDIDACDKEGWTPVHAAAHWGQQAALEILSEHGADLNARSKLGQTAVDLAEPDIVKVLEELKKKQHDRTSINATTPVIRTNPGGPPPLKRSTLERNSIDHVRELMQHDLEIDRSSITRIKDSKLYLGDVKQERAALEASMDQTSPKIIFSKPPSFPDSPKEDREKNDEKREESEESDSENSEESTESEEEQPNSKHTVNSVPNRKAPTANSGPQLGSESDGSESETEESSEEEEPCRTSTTGSVRTTSVTRAQSTPSSVTSPTSRQAHYSSRIGNIESSKSSSFGREEKKEEPTQSRFAAYPRRTTGFSTSTSSTDTARNRISSASDDNKETEKAAPTRTTRAKKVTKRANTGWVGGPLAVGDQQADSAEKEVNDLDSKKTDNTGSRNVRSSREEPGSSRSSAFRSADGRSATLETDTPSSYSSRRGRPSSSDDRNDVEAGTGRRTYPRSADRSKDNEEPEMPAWKLRLREREKARKEKEEKEKAEKEKAEKEREEREKARKEKEKEEKEKAEKEKAEREKAEKEKENQVPSWRRSRTQEKEKEKEREKEKEKEKEEETSAQRARRARKPREKRRGTGVTYMPEESDEDESAEAKDAKKNTKLNEDRFRTGRTNKANAVPEITETDPKKLKEKVQDVQVELQDYKVKFEKALQEKEALQRKLSQTEDELKQVTADNQRLKDENGALIRVISKLSRTPT